MIDRARIEIRRGTIRPEDVSLIYLEPKRRIVRVHNISFDEMANMIGVPSHYGEFFLKETDRLMGFEDLNDVHCFGGQQIRQISASR